MKKQYSGKYDLMIETAVTRFEQGGFLTGDAIKIKKSALSNEYVKNMSEQYKDRLKAFIASDVNLRVSAVKSIRSNTSTGEMGGVRAPADYFVDIVQEINPGMWVNPLTVPMEIIEKLDYDNLTQYAPIPDALKRKNNIDMGSEDIGAVPETQVKGEDINLPKKNTKLSNANKWDDDKPGAGNTKGLKKLVNASVDPLKKNDVDLLAETYSLIYEQDPLGIPKLPIPGVNLSDTPLPDPGLPTPPVPPVAASAPTGQPPVNPLSGFLQKGPRPEYVIQALQNIGIDTDGIKNVQPDFFNDISIINLKEKFKKMGYSDQEADFYLQRTMQEIEKTGMPNMGASSKGPGAFSADIGDGEMNAAPTWGDGQDARTQAQQASWGRQDARSAQLRNDRAQALNARNVLQTQRDVQRRVKENERANQQTINKLGQQVGRKDWSGAAATGLGALVRGSPEEQARREYELSQNELQRRQQLGRQ